METRAEYHEAQVRKMMTLLFIKRAKRHLKTLAELYSWSPETLATYEERFIRTGDLIPTWADPTPPVREEDEDD